MLELIHSTTTTTTPISQGNVTHLISCLNASNGKIAVTTATTWTSARNKLKQQTKQNNNNNNSNTNSN